METVALTLMIITIARVDLAHLPMAGNFNPFMDETSSIAEDSSTSENQSLSDHAGPSLDIIDFHPHHDDQDLENNSAVDTAKRILIQPSIDFLDAQLHGGDEHVHDKSNKQAEEAANLDDYRRWLKEQNENDQLDRFLSLQKEVNRFHLQNSEGLTAKLNRTIEELKSAARDKSRQKHEL